MAGRSEDTHPGRESGATGPTEGAEVAADRDREPSVDGEGFADTAGPGASSAQAPEPGTVLDDATSTVTNTGPSS
jgi:hypothetical protein